MFNNYERVMLRNWNLIPHNWMEWKTKNKLQEEMKRFLIKIKDSLERAIFYICCAFNNIIEMVLEGKN